MDDIAALFDRPIAYHRAFVRLGVGATGAIFLSQAVYWARRTGSDANGWFWKTQQDWEEETGLTRTEQTTARKKLRELGILLEDRRGVPCKLWFNIDFDTLACRISAAGNPQSSMQESCDLDCWDPADRPAENQQSLSLLITTETTAETTETPPPPRAHASLEPPVEPGLAHQDQGPPPGADPPWLEAERARATGEHAAARDQLAADAPFAMHPGWRPGPQFAARATMAGMPGEFGEAQLGEFVSYWHAEGCALRQGQWEHRLLRRLQQDALRATQTPTGDRNAPSKHHRETPLQASLREAEDILRQSRAGTLGPAWGSLGRGGDDVFGAVFEAERTLPAQGGDGVPRQIAGRVADT